MLWYLWCHILPVRSLNIKNFWYFLKQNFLQFSQMQVKILSKFKVIPQGKKEFWVVRRLWIELSLIKCPYKQLKIIIFAADQSSTKIGYWQQLIALINIQICKLIITHGNIFFTFWYSTTVTRASCPIPLKRSTFWKYIITN